MIKNKIQIVLFFVVVIFLLLSIFNQDRIPRPTKEFYVNDYAMALSPAIEHIIVSKGNLLYDLYRDKEGNGGAQIVFITLNKTEKISRNELTDVFNKWKIGKNDMGLLYVIYFEEVEYDGYTLMEYDSIEWIIGYQMEIYLSASKIGQLVDNTIEVEYSLNMGIARLLHETLRVIAMDAYEVETFADFDVDGYEEFFDSYVGSGSDSLEMGILSYLLSPYASFGDKLTAIIPIIIVLIIGGSRFIIRGGGGSSGSAGGFRRRR